MHCADLFTHFLLLFINYIVDETILLKLLLFSMTVNYFNKNILDEIVVSLFDSF